MNRCELLISSSFHPKKIVEEAGDFLEAWHSHGLGNEFAAFCQGDLYVGDGFGEHQHLLVALCHSDCDQFFHFAINFSATMTPIIPDGYFFLHKIELI